MVSRKSKRVSKSSSVSCPLCGCQNFALFFTLSNIPVNVCVQWPTSRQALQCPRADIKLAFCTECSFVWNVAFNPALLNYSPAYENSLFYSPHYSSYTDALAERLIDTYNLHNKEVIDIGCGKGDFLAILCNKGNNKGVGFDSSYEGLDNNIKGSESITIIRDFYSEKYAEYQAHFICSRYVFEHIQQPKQFLCMIRNNINQRKNVVIYFEVPNVSLILHRLSVWDIIYEHCSYFSRESLRWIFSSCRFDVLDLYTCYDEQFLAIEALPANGKTELSVSPISALKEMTEQVNSFVNRHLEQVNSWQRSLENFKEKGQRVVLWGAGAKGVSFLNMLNITDQIKYVVDVNPRKQGKYIAGTGQQIVSPVFLRDYNPDVVIPANPVYEQEIRRTIESLGLYPKLYFRRQTYVGKS